MKFLIKAHGWLVAGAKVLQPVFLLVIRLTWGWKFFEAGLGKLKDIPKVVGFFTQLHIPAPEINAYLAATTECVGGALLILGLLTRVVSIPLIFTMIVAYLTAEPEAVHALIHGNPELFFAAAPFLFLFASIITLVFGPGVVSLDRLIDVLFIKNKSPRH